MTTNNTNKSFSLRRTTSPHIGIIIILIIFVLAWVPYAVKTNDWTPIGILPLGLVLLTPIIYLESRYRIWWRNDAIVRRVAGFKSTVTVIKAEDIKNIKQETSDIQTVLSLSRPLRRITIYGNTSDGLQKIDISLKHFKLDDVRKIMKLIHQKRPDLSLPQQWIDDSIPISKIKSEIVYGTSKQKWQLIGLIILAATLFFLALKFS